MRSKKVSIIIPVYNGENYMREAIDSALAQTYDNIEIIVVNDGSKDKTDEIARSYGDKIIYLKKENGGVSTALNLAIEKMTGDYFSWLSHDDRYYPQKIEAEMDYLEENDLLDKKVILYSDYDIMNNKSKVYDDSVKDHEILEKNPDYCILRGEINGLTLLIPKQAFVDCGNFRTDLRCVQDYVLWAKMLDAGYLFLHIPQKLVTTRLHKMQQGNTSPVMVSEGNEFWTNLIAGTSKERMVRFEGSEYRFFENMHRIMLTTPYDKAIEYTERECEKIVEDVNRHIDGVKVTVVIPFSGGADLLEKSINSVLSQTHKNWELLIVCTTDNAVSETKEKIKNITSARIITAEGAGYLSACNKGIEKADGEYIAFLLPGDTFAPEKTARQLYNALLYNANFLHTNYYMEIAGTGKKSKVGSSVIDGKGLPDIIDNMCIALSTVMFKTSFLHGYNLLFDTSLAAGGDICFCIDCLKHTPILANTEFLCTVGEKNVPFKGERKELLNRIKAVAGFVTADRDLSKYNYNLGILFAKFVSIYDKGKDKPKICSLPIKIKKTKRGIVRQTLAFIRDNGIICTVKYAVEKFKRR